MAEKPDSVIECAAESSDSAVAREDKAEGDVNLEGSEKDAELSIKNEQKVKSETVANLQEMHKIGIQYWSNFEQMLIARLNKIPDDKSLTKREFLDREEHFNLEMSKDFKKMKELCEGNFKELFQELEEAIDRAQKLIEVEREKVKNRLRKVQREREDELERKSQEYLKQMEEVRTKQETRALRKTKSDEVIDIQNLFDEGEEIAIRKERQLEKQHAAVDDEIIVQVSEPIIIQESGTNVESCILVKELKIAVSEEIIVPVEEVVELKETEIIVELACVTVEEQIFAVAEKTHIQMQETVEMKVTDVTAETNCANDEKSVPKLVEKLCGQVNEITELKENDVTVKNENLIVEERVESKRIEIPCDDIVVDELSEESCVVKEQVDVEISNVNAVISETGQKIAKQKEQLHVRNAVSATTVLKNAFVREIAFNQKCKISNSDKWLITNVFVCFVMTLNIFMYNGLFGNVSEERGTNTKRTDVGETDGALKPRGRGDRRMVVGNHEAKAAGQQWQENGRGFSPHIAIVFAVA